jgi:hypothetical protein
MHIRVFVVTGLDGTERHQATVGVFDNLQGRIVAYGTFADAEVEVER